jgi:UDP-glucuronate decarboxylase
MKPNDLEKILVTGAAGFLGSHLVDLLLSEAKEVVGVDNLSTGRKVNLSRALHSPRFRLRTADLISTRALPRFDRAYHLASPASPPAYQTDPIGTLWVNSVGTRRVLESARRSDARVLIASTSEVYGDPRVHPQPERYWGNVNPVGLRSCYDEGKRFSEALAMAYRRRYGLDVRVARIFNTYGPRMDVNDGRVVSNFVTQGLRGEPFTVYGTGRQTRSFCYVSDLVRGLQMFMEARPTVPNPMNFGNPEEITIRELAARVARAVGRPLRVNYLPLPGDDPRQRCPDIQAARKSLGWSPRVSFERGIRETIAYFRTIDRREG